MNLIKLAKTGVHSSKRIFIILTLVFGLTGCSTLAEEFASKAADLKMQRVVLTGSRFQHVVYTKTGYSSKTLHVYLDGDGNPWIAGRPSDDPTPGNPLVLNLMALDVAPAVYVGRPCYHGVESIGECSSRFWLQERYSEEVVASLAAVIKQLLKQGGYQKVSLFGHSGGGVLAVLLASRLPQTVSVVTVAANLDLDAWADYTKPNDLSGSLNPAFLAPLSPLVLQYHYAGGKDEIVPPTLMANAAIHLGSKLIVVDDYDHLCCWEQIWLTVLDDLAKKL
jgi:pimeloyl-ACP methyl ester carboxylesterase